jgi:hypothetical protein
MPDARSVKAARTIVQHQEHTSRAEGRGRGLHFIDHQTDS